MIDVKKLESLSEAGREELALALILWKDFKTEGKMDLRITVDFYAMADMLGVRAEVDKLLPRLPPLVIKPRDA